MSKRFYSQDSQKDEKSHKKSIPLADSKAKPEVGYNGVFVI